MCPIKYPNFLLSLAFSTIVGVSCRKEVVTQDIDSSIFTSPADSLKYNSDWNYVSHGNGDQNYNVVFPQDAVNSIEIIMTAVQWTNIKANVKSITGFDFGVNTPQPPATTTNDPDYVDVTLRYNGKTWKNVGFRLKGNSTLRLAWQQGNYKLPFRLNFDEFEDKFPAITNQHFYGFEEMTFSPGAKDPSLIREKTTSDIFRMAGIPAARTAFYRVYIDFGSGLKYCGVYTGIELPDDNMIKSQFGEEKGNMYKPESNLSVFNASFFEKKNNDVASDYSDVKAFVAALNSGLRITAPSEWRAGLEGVFNMDHFLKYLAVNNAIVNWDSYRVMAHNFYFYNHTVKKLTWIPWDHNEAMTGSPGIMGASQPGGGGRTGLSLSMNEVTNSWPLIRYVADDSVYLQTYKNYLKDFRQYIFTEAAMNALFDKYHALITPYAIGATGEQPGYTYLTGSGGFSTALSSLKNHVTARRSVISNYVP